MCWQVRYDSGLERLLEALLRCFALVEFGKTITFTGVGLDFSIVLVIGVDR